MKIKMKKKDTKHRVVDLVHLKSFKFHITATRGTIIHKETTTTLKRKKEEENKSKAELD